MTRLFCLIVFCFIALFGKAQYEPYQELTIQNEFQLLKNHSYEGESYNYKVIGENERILILGNVNNKGIAKGKWLFFNEVGEKKSGGEYKNGKMHGKWWFTDVLCDIRFKKNKLTYRECYNF